MTRILIWIACISAVILASVAGEQLMTGHAPTWGEMICPYVAGAVCAALGPVLWPWR